MALRSLRPWLIGVGLAAVFPVVLGYVGDRYPDQSGTAFSTIFVIALAGNMAINKTFGYIAQEYGVQQYPKVMLVLLGLGGRADVYGMLNAYKSAESRASVIPCKSLPRYFLVSQLRAASSRERARRTGANSVVRMQAASCAM